MATKKTASKKTQRKAPSAKVNKDQDKALAVMFEAVGCLCDALSTSGGCRKGHVDQAIIHLAVAEQFLPE